MTELEIFLKQQITKATIDKLIAKCELECIECTVTYYGGTSGVSKKRMAVYILGLVDECMEGVVSKVKFNKSELGYLNKKQEALMETMQTFGSKLIDLAVPKQ